MKPPLTLFFFLLSGLYVSLTSTSLSQDHLNILRLQIANPLGTLGRNSALVGGLCTPLFTGIILPFSDSVDGLDNHQQSHPRRTSKIRDPSKSLQNHDYLRIFPSMPTLLGKKAFLRNHKPSSYLNNPLQ